MGTENPWDESTDHLAVMCQRAGQGVEEILQKQHKLGKAVFIVTLICTIVTVQGPANFIQYTITSLSKIVHQIFLQHYFMWMLHTSKLIYNTIHNYIYDKLTDGKESLI